MKIACYHYTPVFTLLKSSRFVLLFTPYYHPAQQNGKGIREARKAQKNGWLTAPAQFKEYERSEFHIKQFAPFKTHRIQPNSNPTHPYNASAGSYIPKTRPQCNASIW